MGGYALGEGLVLVEGVAEEGGLVVDECDVDEVAAFDVELLGQQELVDHHFPE